MKSLPVELDVRKIYKVLHIKGYAWILFFILTSILGLNPALSENIPNEKDIFQLEKAEFDMIEKIMFKRLSYKIQEDALTWSEEYKNEYGEKAFDALLERYMKTESFMRNSIIAFRFQNTAQAKQMYQEIELLAKIAKEKNSTWKQKLRKSRSTFLQNSRDLAEELKASRHNAEVEFRELNSIIRKHNRLVGEYNKKFMGGLEFINPPEAAGAL